MRHFTAARVIALAIVLAITTSSQHARAQNSGVRAATRVQVTRPMREIGTALAVPSESLSNPNLKVLSAGRVYDVDKVNDEVGVRAAVVAERTGTSPRALPSEDESARALDAKPLAAYALPIRFRALAQLPGDAAPRPVEFEAVVLVMNALRFRESTRRFEADLFVGLRNPAAPRDRSTLAEPVKVLVSADADEVAPGELEIVRLGDPRIVKISSLSPVAPFKVSAKTLMDDGDSVEVPVVRPTLKVEGARAMINGLGLEKTTIHLQADGIADASKMRVSVKTTRGEVQPSDVQLGADGHGTVELRSAGVGVATIIASGVPFTSGAGEVTFEKPWSFLVAALVGAIAGWLLRTRARSKSARSALVAIAGAAIVTAACSIGIRLVQWAPAATVGEALTFFVAAIGAYFGLKAIMPVTARDR